jgi:hypothetical protein
MLLMSLADNSAKLHYQSSTDKVVLTIVPASADSNSHRHCSEGRPNTFDPMSAPARPRVTAYVQLGHGSKHVADIDHESLILRELEGNEDSELPDRD